MLRKSKRKVNLIKHFTLFYSGLLILTLLILPGSCGFSSAQTTEYSFISKPSNIPFLTDWETPILEPGMEDELTFTIENRYDEGGIPSNDLIDVSLTLGIYKWATLEKSRAVNQDFDNAPEIVEGVSFEESYDERFNESHGMITIEPETGIVLFRFHWPLIKNDTIFNIEIVISTDSGTPEGTYFVKTELTFDHSGIDNESFVMRSMGHYSRDDWDHAKNTAPEDFPPAINLTYLELNGIIPETSFSVMHPLPFWPFYVFAGLTGLMALLAIVFYYMEEHGRFPNLKAKLDRFGKKLR